MMNIKRAALVLLMAMTSLALFSCRKGTVMQKKSGLSEIRERGYITIATSPDYPPFEFVGDDDEPEGIEIELIAKIAEEMNLKLRYLTVEYEDIVPGVLSGAYDLGVSGFMIDESMADSVLFSTPHSLGGLRIVVPLSSGIRGTESLNGARIAVQANSEAYDYCNSKGYKVVSYKKSADALQAVCSGAADAWITDNSMGSLLMRRYNQENKDQLIMLDDLLTRDEYAFIASKDNEDFIIEVNKSMRKLGDDGTIGRIFQKYDTVYSRAKDYILK